MDTIWITVAVLGVTGIIAAAVLWFVARRFHVYEDPRIGEVEALLPGANCGSCGHSGCHAFAAACVSASSLDSLSCPVGGDKTMQGIASLLGLKAGETIRRVAVVRCSAGCSQRDKRVTYDGVRSCAIEAATCSGERDCPHGCLGCGDCARACPYGVITMDAATSMPVVDFDRCVGCGLCAKGCPRGIIELQQHTPGKALVWVTCVNRDKGPVAMKECDSSCIGCSKCKRVCPSGAVTIDSFLSHIDASRCIGCGLCIEACPRKCITAHGTPDPSVIPSQNS